MNTIHIYNKDCLKCVKEDIAPHSVDCVVTSPPYGGHVHNGRRKNASINKTYDVYEDNIDTEAYNKLCVDLFKGLETALKPNGVVCWNVSYNKANSEQFLRAIYNIINETEFTIAEVMTWKKPMAITVDSPNRLTRICEQVYILVRRDDYETYFCNKPVSSVDESGKKWYSGVMNYIEAKNSDGPNDLNGAVFSTEFATKLISLYCPVGGVVYDPFMGTGTTAKACVVTNRKCVGSELSLAQCEYAKRRVDSLLARVVIEKDASQPEVEPANTEEA